MDKFTLEFMKYNEIFIQSFKVNSQNIIKNYNVKDNNISIEHINFIVIGKAGVGKSVFINESLLLPEEKRAKVGRGKSVTDKSSVYESDKLKMIRMWDTQGLDYKISQEFILNEIKRIVDNGLKQGPDHYINIILYCITAERFQDEDAQLIYEIMKLYPSDNLPVIITQLQAYFEQRAKEMQETIRGILSEYLDKSIADKIEIRDIVASEQKGKTEVYKARGIPELLKLSVELMGRSITSATCKKFSQEIEKLCKNYIEKQINYIEKQFKYEMEILDVSRSMYVEDMEDLPAPEKKQIKHYQK
jgi:predicted GTPase